MIASTKAELDRDPTKPSQWAMLAHSYEMLGDFKKAADAYKKLLELQPRDAQAHADYADTLGVAQQGSLKGEPARLIDKALAIDPSNLKALVLAGKADFENKHFEAATARWEQALRVSKDPATSRQIEISVAEARALSPKSPGTPASAPVGLAFVAGRVSVDPGLGKSLSPDDTVFIFARPAEGSRMPVAMLRRHVRDLPIDFALDDSLSMVAGTKLSKFEHVIVGARISHRGDVIPAAGDLQGTVGPVALGSTGLKVEINAVVK